MPNNRRSRIITEGFARSPNRAMLRAVGFDDGDFDKPIVGVANGHSTMNPCNAGIQPLVDRAMEALKFRMTCNPSYDFDSPLISNGCRPDGRSFWNRMNGRWILDFASSEV